MGLCDKLSLSLKHVNPCGFDRFTMDTWQRGIEGRPFTLELELQCPRAVSPSHPPSFSKFVVLNKRTIANRSTWHSSRTEEVTNDRYLFLTTNSRRKWVQKQNKSFVHTKKKKGLWSLSQVRFYGATNDQLVQETMEGDADAR